MKVSEQKVSSNITYTLNEVNQASGPSQQNHARSLREGQVFTGEILDIRKDQVTIQFNGKQIMYARLADNMELTIGQKLEFQVKENHGDVIVLKPASSDSNTGAGDTTILRALQAANLPNQAKAVELVKLLMLHQMPIDKSTLQKLYQQLISNQKSDVETIVLMNKYGMKITNEHMEQFNNYKNYEHRISNGIEQMAKAITDSFTNLIDNKAYDQGMEFNHKLLALLTKETGIHQQQSLEEQNRSLYGDQGNKDGNQQLSEGLGKNLQGSNPLLNNNQGTLEVSKQLDASEQLNASKQILEESNQILEENLRTSISKGQLQEKSSATQINKQMQRNEFATNTSNPLNAVENSKFLTLLNQLGLDKLFKEALATSKNGPNPIQALEASSTNDMLKALDISLQKAMETGSSDNEQLVRHLLDSNEYKKLIIEHVKNQLFLTPEEVAKEHSISKLYETLEESMKEIQNLIQDNDNAGQKLAFVSKGIQENIDFMKNLNQMFTYIQIPLKLKNQEANGELFVFTDKEALKNKKGSISALFHLDLANLGLLDIYINKQDQTIQGQFYCSKAEITNLVEQHMSRLNDLLSQKGYQMYMQAITREEKLDFVHDFINAGQEELLIKRYSFDVRA